MPQRTEKGEGVWQQLREEAAAGGTVVDGRRCTVLRKLLAEGHRVV